MLVDTHCHIHESDYPLDRAEVLARARAAGVTKMICVGTSQVSSVQAIEFAARYQGVFASVGVHPHDTKDGWSTVATLVASAPVNLVAVGEIGLDYYYNHSPRDIQIEALEVQIAVALRHNLPIIFHVRDAFDDFWPIFDNFQGIRGELHSFTDSLKNMEEALKRGLYIGVNGISTFTKDMVQQQMFAQVPLEKMLLETDAPFLTPQPFRGSINEPVFVRNVAEHHATLRDISIDHLAVATTANAHALFALS